MQNAKTEQKVLFFSHFLSLCAHCVHLTWQFKCKQMMFNWLTYCLMQQRQYKHRSASAAVKLTDSKRQSTSEREWEDMVLKLEVEVKQKNCKAQRVLHSRKMTCWFECDMKKKRFQRTWWGLYITKWRCWISEQ